MSDTSDNRPVNAQPGAARRRKACLRLAVILTPVLAWLFWQVASDDGREEDLQGVADRTGPSPRDSRPYILPQIAPTRFRNASREVEYVGNRACVDCHPDEHESYLQTSHSRSLEPVVVAQEPPDGDFFHELSGRHYRVYRDGETLRLQEYIEEDSGDRVVLVDQPAQYALGSGNHARMYFVKIGDYLVESPMTWYPRRKVWGMSAGFELDPQQQGFGREVSAGCLYCHAGRVATMGASDLRMEVEELAISCERCHGPGALHVAERKANRPVRDGLDDSIVNLRHLSRERQEDVCSQCHLSSLADVNVHGRSVEDFRPGMRMSDFRVSYRVDRPESARTVSGQIEQMRQSRCYIESESMTCFTCHDPHTSPGQAAGIGHYRQTCLNCHPGDSCRASAGARAGTQPADNCISCHMPKGPTDIPHFSFTHHRVGIHEDASGKIRYVETDRLVPVAGISHLPPLEQRRLIGLANDQFAGNLAGGLDDEFRYDASYRALSDVFRNRARQVLTEVRAAGVKDPDVELFFSRAHWRTDPARCILHAESALQSPTIPPALRRAALFNLASSYFDQGRCDRAQPYLEELVQQERNEIPLMLLGICHQKQGDLEGAVRLVKEAIAADPTRADLHTFLASVCHQRGDQSEAEKHLQRAELLSRRIPQPR